MEQKVNPHGLRIGVIRDWDSKWYEDAEFADFLVEDYVCGKWLQTKFRTKIGMHILKKSQ